MSDVSRRDNTDIELERGIDKKYFFKCQLYSSDRKNK